ncbi:hypothetical protein [Nocardioides marmoribigeumensis]|uniref:Uncharacterized protein n=1 Tax=Nocardioides marmoribigeumensis TaxID=433649 RepID=A0ABU2BTC9_9ACTN|nr:hypothetical protein [Nocardioides marmoribigeumensis]MDR7361891.1 hypothetical protein [Nocardioides marmoribigeumensis]
MCRPVTCKTCGKTTWAGCGQHVAQVRSIVPTSEWCGGHAKQSDATKPTGFARFFGRR